MRVDPETCKPYTDEDQKKVDEFYVECARSDVKERHPGYMPGWTRFQFTIFSMLVSGSILAGYSVK